MRNLLLASCILIITGCDAIKPQDAVLKLDGPKWELTAISRKPVSASGKAYLEFDQKDQEIKGKAFCNSIKAGYELMGKDQLTFEDIVSTKMFCDGVMDLENQVITSLQNVRRYEIKNGSLYLYSTDELLLTFKR